MGRTNDELRVTRGAIAGGDVDFNTATMNLLSHFVPGAIEEVKNRFQNEQWTNELAGYIDLENTDQWDNEAALELSSQKNNELFQEGIFDVRLKTIWSFVLYMMNATREQMQPILIDLGSAFDELTEEEDQKSRASILVWAVLANFYGIQPTDEINNNNVNGAAKNSSGGCYIATAVYGSYDCPEVWVLRRYRDLHLRESITGKAFIKVYYAVSPTLVKWFGNFDLIQSPIKRILNRWIDRLRLSGFSDTPYSDK